ncbi:hypothetical protein [Negativicoccus succinicivorans]|uniref:hypothetical protein n=1 Tax=Negativicoccus succinicivorans TaxID=620903 RepID=UPI00290D660D|nr:hypothetical protein [Negativicoccus succinicivorans]MDU5529560.1 hypothetical protein [Negativicoccus succinicivorans]
MIKKLVGFLTVLCMAFFIAGCSSTPDVSGTYLRLNKDNQPTSTIVLKKVSDNSYDLSFSIINWRTGKMEKVESKRMTLNTEKKTLEENPTIPQNLFFNENYSSITRVSSSISGANTENVYKKLSDSEIKQYQHLFE